MRKRIILKTVLLTLCFAGFVFSQESILERIKGLPDVAEVKIVDSDSLFKETFEIKFSQPLDHADPNGKKFLQYVYLSHRDAGGPMVINTEGYSVRRNSPTELSRLLKANQLTVEYRFYGKSKSDSITDWRFLTNRQASEDYHHIAEVFKKIYPGKWISTGISKGGETTIIYRRFFPKDVSVSVPYVAPMNLAQEDPRTDHFLDTIGDESCRNKVIAFQRMILKKRPVLIPMIEEYAKTKNVRFSIGADAVLEYAACEFPFYFWQYGGSCDSIPTEDSSNRAVFQYLTTKPGFRLYSDDGIKTGELSMYQHMTELGYYGFVTKNVSDLLVSVKHPSNKFFLPKNTPIVYNDKFIPDILNWVNTEGNNMLFIYGGSDTWGACAVQLSGKTNAVKMVRSGGSHRTRIKDFSKEDKEKIYSTLEKWLDVKIAR